MDLHPGEESRKRPFAIVELHGGARAGRQRLVTVLIPRGAGVDPHAVSAIGNLNAAGAQIVVTTPDGVRNLQVTASGVVELP